MRLLCTARETAIGLEDVYDLPIAIQRKYRRTSAASCFSNNMVVAKPAVKPKIAAMNIVVFLNFAKVRNMMISITL